MLSDDQIIAVLKSMQGGKAGFRVYWGYVTFARAIEAEVRKDDEALIRQLWDLVQSQHDYIMALPADVVASLPAMPGFDGEWADGVKSAATARLEKAP